MKMIGMYKLHRFVLAKDGRDVQTNNERIKCMHNAIK